MTGRRTLAIAALLGSVVCGVVACLSPRSLPEMVHYTLAPPGAPTENLGGPVRVRRFGIDPVYANVRLAHRSSPYRIEYYTFHRWAGPPQDVVTSAVRDYLDRAPAAPAGPPVVVSGIVRRLEERLGPAEGQAATPVGNAKRSGSRVRSGLVAIEFTVHRDGRVILDREYEQSETAAGGTPEESVAAISRALARMLDQLVRDVRQAEAGGSQPADVPGTQPMERVR
jgi:ABC-type uncharacterized transport system auxiliary subunit